MSDGRFGFLQSAIGYTLIAVVLLSSLALGANRPVSWMFLATVILFLFGCQLLYGAISAPPVALRKASLPATLYLLAVLWAAIQILPGMPAAMVHPYWATVPEATAYISADPGQGRHGIMRLLAYAMIFWMAVRAGSNPATAARMLRIIALFSTALAIFGLYAFFTGTNPILDDLTANSVMQASFVNRNNYATYAIFGALANIAAYLHVTQGQSGGRDDRIGRLRDALEGFYGGAWLYGLGVIVCIGAISLTQSRGGAMAGILAVFVMYRLWRGKGRQRDWVMAGVLLAIVLFIAFTSATGLAQRLLATSDEDGRFIVFPAIVDGIAARPLLGHGLGAFHDAFRPFLPPEAAVGEWLRAHNSFLENLFELGIPAALALFGSLALILRRLWRGSVSRHRHRIFPVFGLSCAAAAAVHSLVDFSLQMPATAALFAAILGICFAQSFREDELTFATRRSSSRSGSRSGQRSRRRAKNSI